MTQCQNWGHLKPDTPFNEIFPDRTVPLRSIFITPRQKGSPPCYVVDADFLTQEQIDRLAQRLFELWRPECETVEMARDYIRQGLPLKTDWFNGCGTSSPAILFGLMDDEGLGRDEADNLDEIAEINEARYGYPYVYDDGYDDYQDDEIDEEYPRY